MNGLVSVIMGVHDEREDYLRCSVESICSQTYPNLELIVIDDASRERCRATLESLAAEYPCIRIIHNPANLGLTKSLNIGLDAARGEYIARMDADDYSMPDRLEKQVAYLLEHKDIDIIGTGVISFGDEVVFMSPDKGMDNGRAQCNLFFSSTLCHPSVMMRSDFLSKHGLRYDESISKGQDYDLWERCSVAGRMAVMKDVLLYYRIHPGQISAKGRAAQEQAADKVRLRRLCRLGLTPDSDEYKCHRLLCGDVDRTVTVAHERRWVKKILRANDAALLVSRRTLKKELGRRFTLFKLRNGHIASLINVHDVVNLTAIAFSRLAAAISLSRHSLGPKASPLVEKLELARRRLASPRRYVSKLFQKRMGYPLNLDNPTTYSEKLQWLKLNWRDPLATALVDKYKVKEYVAQKIGPQYIIPTIGVWKRARDIDWDSLPEQFVLKCTHDSGGHIICMDKASLNKKAAMKKLQKSLATDYYYYGFEWPYKNVERRIIAEPYMEDPATGELRDYKFFCFDGCVKALFVASGRNVPGVDVKFDFFDADYVHLPFRQGHENAGTTPAKPVCFEQMKHLAEALSSGLPHVRVDLYEVAGKVYFGEMTFFHHGGWTPFDPPQWDNIFGSWLNLPRVKQ